MLHRNKLLSIFALALASSNTFAGRSEPYDPYTAVNYARTWALSRNTTYPDFSAGGGDCTNFVSQALKAGGFRNTIANSPMSDQRWYFVSKTSYSQTWSSANGLFSRFNNGYENWVRWNSIDSLNYGDIVFADWDGQGTIDHTMIVTGFKKLADGTPDPVFSYHSTDRKDNPRSSFVLAAPKTTRYYRFGKENACFIVKANQYIN